MFCDEAHGDSLWIGTIDGVGFGTIVVVFPRGNCDVGLAY